MWHNPTYVAGVPGASAARLSSETIIRDQPAPLDQAQTRTEFLLLLRFAMCSSLYARSLPSSSLRHPEIDGPRTTMKRGITVLLSLSILATGAYFTASKWAI